MKIHLISDLHLGFNEASTDDDVTIPDVDLVVLNGNIGMTKRSMLYAESLCNKYPDIPFVCNLGETEKILNFGKYVGDLEENMLIRKSSNPTWPKNLYYDHYEPIYLKLKNGQEVDIFCAYGYPKIHKLEVAWEETIWFKEYISHISDDPSLILHNHEGLYHGSVPVFATKDWINEQHDKEWHMIKKWELVPAAKKILITHINPLKDTRCIGQITSSFNIHLDNGVWLTSNFRVNNVKYVGSRLFSNPGRGSEARANVIVID